MFVFQVVVVTLAFAICWLPIHVLELMNCANSSVLYTLIRSYPKVLYTIRAFTHALAYFNSCLNPYLYALLNRNFCCDLIDLIPSCCIRRGQNQSFQSNASKLNIKLLSPTIIPDESLLKNAPNNEEDYEEDEAEYNEKVKSKHADASCEIELLAI